MGEVLDDDVRKQLLRFVAAQRSDHAQEIEVLLLELAPLEAELLGPDALEAIAAGGDAFTEDLGGKNLEFAEVLATLGSIASLAQVTWASLTWLRKSSGRARVDEWHEPTPDEIKATVIALLESDPELKKRCLTLDRLDEVVDFVSQRNIDRQRNANR